MFIDINKIGPDGVRFDTDLELPDVDQNGWEPVPIRAAHLSGEIRKGERGMELHACLDAMAEVVCSRCLDPMKEEIVSSFLLILVPEAPDPQSAESDVDGLNESLADGALDEALHHAEDGLIDLKAVAAEQIYLTLNRKPVCSPTCSGLCPGCGVNRNRAECRCSGEEIDPRLLPLLKFRKT